MAGFLDVLLRGLMLSGGALALGGVVFLRVVLRAGPGPAPDAVALRSLRLVALGAGVAAAAQLALALVALGAIVSDLGAGAVAAFARTPFVLVCAARIALALATIALARRVARGPAGALAWTLLGGAAGLLVASSAAISHAAARMDARATLMGLDAVHQLAAAAWTGGLVHVLGSLHTATGGARASWDAVRRFSTVALVSVATLVAAGVALAVAYIGDAGALIGTAYGVMVLTKAVLLAAVLALASASFRLVRRAATSAAPVRLARLVEVEAGLLVTVLFAAASLTSVPPATDVHADRASAAEVAARFTAMPPRLASPDVGELLRQTNPLAGGPETRLRIEREWSEFNHHWAGLFVLAMGFAAAAHQAGVRALRHWPLLLVGLALFLVVRNDPEVWPLGPIGFWESLAQPEVFQHRIFMALVTVFGLFEWAVHLGRLPARPWAYVFPVLCAAGGGLLLTHSHAVFSLKEAFLMEVTHAPIGIFGAFAGWARWLELRLPEAAPVARRVWPVCLVAVGVVLLFYSEGGPP